MTKRSLSVPLRKAALALLATVPALAQPNEAVLYNFQNAPRGGYPTGTLFRDASGDLYGTTQIGGLSNAGIVFKLDAAGNETVLYSFKGGTEWELSLRRRGARLGRQSLRDYPVWRNIDGRLHRWLWRRI
jgi:uncharacterized repeat protein (TIGR03803 family)